MVRGKILRQTSERKNYLFRLLVRNGRLAVALPEISTRDIVGGSLS